MRSRIAVATALLMLGTLSLVGCNRHSENGVRKSLAVATLFFTDAAMLQALDCAAVLKTTRPITRADSTPDGIVRILLQGVTAEERAMGMSSHFEPNPALHLAGTRPLIAYFQGVEVIHGVAFVDFEPDGLAYLNSASCAQTAVKSSLEHTLREFPSILAVKYRIGGKSFDDWDA